MAYIEERTIVPAEYHSPAALMFRRVVYFALNILEVLLALRLVFRAFGATAAAGFIRFINDLTRPFVSPFQGIFAATRTDVGSIEWATVMAMIVYALAAALLIQLVRVLTPAHRH